MRNLKKFCFAICTLLIASCFNNQVFAYNELKHVTISVAADPSGAPFAFLDRSITKPKGLDIDIITELKRRLGFFLAEDRVIPLDFTIGLDKVKNGQLDIFAGGISYSDERAKIFDFTPIYYYSSLGVLYSTKNFKSSAKPNDFKGKKVGFMPGTTAEAYIEHYGMEGVPIYNLTLAVFEVIAGNLDGVLYDRPVIAHFAQTINNSNLSVTDTRFGEESCQFALILPKDAPYNEFFIQAMEDMHQDGTIQQILNKWRAE